MGQTAKKSVEYWNLSSFIDNKEFSQVEFETLFKESVEKRMIADVEIANFLSGGRTTTLLLKTYRFKYRVNTFSVLVGNENITKKNIFKKL